MKAHPLVRILKQGGAYALGNAAIKASRFLLLPFLINTTYLSVVGLGHYALLMVTSVFGVFVISFGVSAALLKFMADAEGASAEALPFTAVVAMVGVSAVALMGCYLAAPWLAAWLVDDAEQTYVVMLLGYYVVAKVLGSLPLTWLRFREQAFTYACINVAESLLMLGLAYWWLVEHQRGLVGLMEAHLVSAVVVAVGMLGFLLTRVRWRFSGTWLRALFRFGTPLILFSLSGWVLNAGDRYLLDWLSDASVVALYDVAARITSVVNLVVVQSFQLVFSVIGLKEVAKKDFSTHRRTFRHYTIWTGWLILGLALFTLDLMSVLVTRFGAASYYLGIDALILPLGVGVLAYGAYIILNNILYASGDTGSMSGVILGAAALNVVLNLIAIPWLGAMGAALSTVLAYLVLALVTARLAGRRQQIQYPWGVFFGVVAVIVVLAWGAALTESWAARPRLLVRGGVWLGYLPLILLLRFYQPHEARAAWAWIQQRLRSVRTGGMKG